MTLVVGTVEREADLFDAAAVLHDGRWAGVYHKHHLPNYGVFDEQRYFAPGRGNAVFVRDGVTLGVSICEDIWFPGGPIEEQAGRGGAEVLLNLSASPYHAGKAGERRRMLREPRHRPPRDRRLREPGGRPGRGAPRRREPDPRTRGARCWPRARCSRRT